MPSKQTFAALGQGRQILASTTATDDDTARAGIRELLDSPLHRKDFLDWMKHGFRVTDYDVCFPNPGKVSQGKQTAGSPDDCFLPENISGSPAPIVFPEKTSAAGIRPMFSQGKQSGFKSFPRENIG